MAPRRLLLAAPRGYCAGVDRAVATVERTLERAGDRPVYVRGEIVHNRHVVDELARRGAIFVPSEVDVPEGETVVFSAHGVAPAVHSTAQARRLDVIDATCPLVTKVHSEARRFAGRGYTILLIGHAGHDEVIGTMGEAPEATLLVQSVGEVERLPAFAPAAKLVYLTQTTLSVDETTEIVEALERRFPWLEAPPSDDICYATTNRQRAVKELAKHVELVLVIGSANSSNSNRLVEVARDAGVASHLIEDESAIDETWLEGVETVGISSGASAPESLVSRVVAWFRDRGVAEAEELNVVTEDVRFNLPRPIRTALPLASPTSTIR